MENNLETLLAHLLLCCFNEEKADATPLEVSCIRSKETNDIVSYKVSAYYVGTCFVIDSKNIALLFEHGDENDEYDPYEFEFKVIQKFISTQLEDNKEAVETFVAKWHNTNSYELPMIPLQN